MVRSAKIRHVARFAAILALVLGLTTPGKANPPDLNVREVCRQTVAGAFLSAHDRTEKAKQQLAIVTAQRAELKIKLADLDREMEGLAKEEAKTSFSVELAAKKNRLVQAQSVFHDQIESYENLMAKAREDHERFQKEEADVRRALDPVFKLKEIPRTEENAGYPFRVEYKHPCSKYRRLCPLPYAMAQSLKKIDILGKTPESCVRYASFSNLNGLQ